MSANGFENKIRLCFLLSLLLFAFAAAAAGEPDYTTGTPWLDSNLEGNVTEETPTNLKDDFVLAVNKDALLALEIPRGVGGTIPDLRQKAEEDTKAMFQGEAPQEHDAGLAFRLYELVSDWDARNALGTAPLKEMTDTVEAISSIGALMNYFAETLPQKRLGLLWVSDPAPDPEDSGRRVLTVKNPETILGDSAEYRALTPMGETRKEAFTAFLGGMLQKLGYSAEEADRKLNNSFLLESLLAPAIPTREETYTAEYMGRQRNRVSREEMISAQGRLPILRELSLRGYPETQELILLSPEYLGTLNGLLTEENLPMFRDYLIVTGIANRAQFLDRESCGLYRAYSDAISGNPAGTDDETYAVSAVLELLPWPTARLYTERYLREEDKERIARLVEEELAAWRGILLEADFLSEETRENAIKKLEAIDSRVLYPDDWSPYALQDLDIPSAGEGGVFYDAVNAIQAYQEAKAAAEFLTPIDKTLWEETPIFLNCFYEETSNSVYIMGAFAQGGCYHSDMTDEELCGRLGMVIGHEISHAFDDQGAQYDADGNLKNWWTQEDFSLFRQRNEKMAAYYSAIHPWEGQDLEADGLVGEACADMAGLKCVLRIAAKKPGFDYDRFFRAYAGFWLNKGNLTNAHRAIHNEHPMPYLRVNCTLQQSDEFLDFYGIREGDGMYLAPEDRVAIW